MFQWFRNVLRGQSALLRRLNSIDQEIRDMSPKLQNLANLVRRQSDLQQSLITAFQGLASQMRDAKDDPAEIDRLASEVETNITSLSSAITDNTPAADTTTPTTPSPTDNSTPPDNTSPGKTEPALPADQTTPATDDSGGGDNSPGT
jgi:ABC-type transporter Mla subunit MlaD